MNANELNIEEQNLIKDILKNIGNDDDLERQFANSIGMSRSKFGKLADSIFDKLQNGRLIVKE